MPSKSIPNMFRILLSDMSISQSDIPFFGRSIYASAIRADMSVVDAEYQGLTPFYRDASRIVKRQYKLHSNKKFMLSVQQEGKQI